jgi:hypothetical protein
MLEVLRKFFDDQGWEYSQIKDSTIFFLGVSGENGNFRCIADLDEENKRFSFFSVFGLNAPDEKKYQMAELITRMNVNEFLGNFEMDFEDGEIRYKTSVWYDGIKPSKKFIENMTMINILTMDNAIPAITGLVFKNLSPLKGYELVNNISSKPQS